MAYDHLEIEARWQRYRDEHGTSSPRAGAAGPSATSSICSPTRPASVCMSVIPRGTPPPNHGARLAHARLRRATPDGLGRVRPAGRIGNINALRRRAPLAWVPSRDITCQTWTRAAPGADGTASIGSLVYSCIAAVYEASGSRSPTMCTSSGRVRIVEHRQLESNRQCFLWWLCPHYYGPCGDHVRPGGRRSNGSPERASGRALRARHDPAAGDPGFRLQLLLYQGGTRNVRNSTAIELRCLRWRASSRLYACGR